MIVFYKTKESLEYFSELPQTRDNSLFIGTVNSLEWWASTAESAATAAGTSAATGTTATWRWSTRSTELIVAALWLLTLSKGCEAIGEGEHSVASQRVVDGILDVACRLGAHDVLLLSKDVVNRELDRSFLVLEELVGN